MSSLITDSSEEEEDDVVGYEVTGAWGRSAEWAFGEVLEAKEATLCPVLTDFNIVNFGEHWRQCIAAAWVAFCRSLYTVRLTQRSSTDCPLGSVTY